MTECYVIRQFLDTSLDTKKGQESGGLELLTRLPHRTVLPGVALIKYPCTSYKPKFPMLGFYFLWSGKNSPAHCCQFSRSTGLPASTSTSTTSCWSFGIP